MTEFRKCKLCGKTAGDLVHYAVRHYACTACLLERKGEAFICSLPDGLLGDVAIFLLSERGYEVVLRRLGMWTETPASASYHDALDLVDGGKETPQCRRCGGKKCGACGGTGYRAAVGK